MTFPELFAVSLGAKLRPGRYQCFWCGTSCDDSIPVKIANTFWDWDVVANRFSRYQCVGCREALNEKRQMDGYDKLQKTRNHSWLATDKPQVESFTKADIDQMRLFCLRPPIQHTWGLAIAATGQKHVIFRTPVNQPGQTVVAVQLELIRVVYDIVDLGPMISLCARLARVLGKPALNGPLNVNHAIRLGSDHRLIETWNKIWNDPLVRLAAFLCPSKGDCDGWIKNDEYGGLPA